MATELTPGTVVALRYEIVSLLGRGGMADVYLARHRLLGRECALKILSPAAARQLGVRFEREARNAASLDHPGCVRVIDYGAGADGSRFLAMDRVDGPTVRELLSARLLSVDEALWMAREVLDGLAHAHARGVLHRDIKPENIMVASDGGGRRVVLIDFGLSRYGDDAPITQLGSCVGSPSYIAPERLLSQPYDGRADLYAIGIVLYETLTGYRPFGGATPMDTARQHIHEEPTPAGELRTDLPPQVVGLIHRALAKDPAARFESAATMMAAVERVRRALPERATLPPPPPTTPASDDETCAELRLHPPSLARRAWARVRFGAWRWRAPLPELTPGR